MFSAEQTNRLPAASGLVIANNSSEATSLTSTTPISQFGTIGYLPFIISRIAPTLTPKSSSKIGPKTIAGKTVESSIPEVSCFMKSQAACSAKVFDFAYTLVVLLFGSVQSSSLKTPCLSVPYIIAATEEVMTTLLTPAFEAAFKTRSVPSTAGFTISSSSFGNCIAIGDATCKT